MAEASARAVLAPDAVLLAQRAHDKWDALRQSGDLLVRIGAVDPPYVDAILERERSISTYLGEGVAIPHGTDASRVHVRRTALGFLRFPDGVDWGGATVTVCIAIAASGDEHVAVLSALAQILIEPDQAERLRSATDPEEVLRLLRPVGEESA
jgi:mannitol/fructose-specific phosphotransferase system IIA component